jgi:hypothetical protein
LTGAGAAVVGAIPMIPLLSATSYILYGGDISRFAGQSGELIISTEMGPAHLADNLLLDSITFSPQAIPEPNVLALFATGLSLLGWRYLSRRAKVARG